MGMTEFKAIIGMWLLAQMFIVPFFVIDNEVDKKDWLTTDFGALALLVVMFFGLKLIGV